MSTPRPSLVIRLFHSGNYSDGRPNVTPVYVPDLDAGYEYQNRKVGNYVPTSGFIDINASSRSMLSFEQGGIKKLSESGLIHSKMFYVPESYAPGTLPDPSSYPPGTFVWSTEGTPYWSNGSGWISGSSPTGSAGGDLSGSYPDPTVSGIHNIPVEPGTPDNGDVFIYNVASGVWEHGPLTFSGGPPSGAAGGSLSGLYPNPTLSSVGTPGTYGSASIVPVLTTSTEGRVTNVTPTPIQISELQVTNLVTDLSNKADKSIQVSAGVGLTGGGNLSSNRTISLSTIGVANTYGSATSIPVFTTDAYGRVITTSVIPIQISESQVTGLVTDLNSINLNISSISLNLATKADKSTSIFAGSGLTGGGNLSTDRTISMPNVGTSGTYGSASYVPVITTDPYGRATSIVNTSIQIDKNQVNNLLSDLNSINFSLTQKTDKLTQISAGSGLIGGGDLSTDRTISMPNVGTSGTYGSVSQVPVLTTDNQGRVTSVVNTPIQISESQVTNLTSDLSSINSSISSINSNLSLKTDRSTSVLAGSGLTGGGDLSTDRTISMPNVGIPNTYGSSSSVPVFTTDPQGRVGNVTNTPVQIDIPQVSGLSVVIGNKVDKLTSILTINGLQGGGDLSVDRTLSPVYGNTPGTVTEGSDPRLSDARNPTGSAGGDLNGSYPNPTISSIQGNAVAAASPQTGQSLVWNGSAWVPASAGGGGGGGGGGGVVYFMNNGTPAESPTTGLSGVIHQLDTQAEIPLTTLTSSELSIGGTYDIIASFVTNVNNPNITALPAGIWDFNVWAQASDLHVNHTFFRVEVYKYDTLGNLTFLGTSDPVPLYEPGSVVQYSSSVVIPQTPIDVTDRIVIELEATTTETGNTITFSFGDRTPSHAHTTIPAVSGTGVVHVINGILQSPASAVNLNGGSSEISGVLPVSNGGTGTSTYTVGDLIYASGASALSLLNDVSTGNVLLSGGISLAPTYGKVGLTTHVDGILPVSNGGTGLNTVPSNGQILIGNGTGYSSAVINSGSGISVTNGVGSITIDNTGVLSVGASAPLSSSGGANPNISLNPSGVLSGGYGSSSSVPTLNITTEGLVASAANAPIQIDVSQVTGLSVDLASKADKTTSIFAGSGLTGGGNLSTDRTISMPDVGTPGTYGTVSQVPVFSTDTQGRVTGATNTSIQIDEIQVTNLTSDLSSKALNSVTISAGSGLVGGGDLTSNRTISMPNVGTSGTYGSASSTNFISTDIQGRVTVVTPTLIQIPESQVTNLVSDLASKAFSSTTISAGSGLVGGGDLTTNRTISMPNVGTSGTYGSAASVPVFTTDAQGRVTNVTPTSISIDASQITSGTLTVLRGGTGLSSSGSSGNILVSNGSTWSSVPMTGDVSITSSGATTVTAIQNQPVTAGTPGSNTVLQYVGGSWTSTSLTSINQAVYQTVTGTASGGITNGQVVYVTNSNGSGTAPPVNLAQANFLATVGTTVGLAFGSIANNGLGTIITQGLATNLNTQAFTQGDILYVSPTTPGALTNVKPSGPNYAVPVGIVVVRNATLGVVYVNPGWFNTIANIADVVLTTPVENDFLKYNPTTGQWNNAPVLKQPNTQTALTLGSGTQITAANILNIVYLPIKTAGGANITLAANPIASLNNNSSDWGRVLWLHNVDNNRSITLPAGGNTKLDGAVNLVLAASSLVKFIWTSVGSGGSWIQSDKAITVG